MTDSLHRCTRFRTVRQEGVWRDAGLLREREVERMRACAECGRVQPVRVRKVIALEREMRRPGPPAADPALRRLGRRLEVLFGGRERLRAAPLTRRLGGIRGELDLEALAACAPIRLGYRPKGGSWHLETVHLLDPVGLAEVARPGTAARHAAVLEQARRATAALGHPQAAAIADLLAEERAARFDDRVIRALAALARLVQDGDVRPARAFSAEVLGHSKSLAALRPRLERLVGPLERLGIRESGGVVLVGGQGHLHLAHAAIDLSRFTCLGLAAQDVLELRELRAPPTGILVVENLTAFHACLERLRGGAAPLVVWSGGFPGRGVTRLLQHAAAGSAQVRVWCDIDLGGVRIARLIDRVSANRAEPVLMEPGVLVAAARVRPLSPEQRDAVRRDLARWPDALLVDTLRAVLERNGWVEQETLLDRIGELAGSAAAGSSRSRDAGATS